MREELGKTRNNSSSSMRLTMNTLSLVVAFTDRWKEREKGTSLLSGRAEGLKKIEVELRGCAKSKWKRTRNRETRKKEKEPVERERNSQTACRHIAVVDAGIRCTVVVAFITHIDLLIKVCLYCYIPSQKWDAESISNTFQWDKNMKKIKHSEVGKNVHFTY